MNATANTTTKTDPLTGLSGDEQAANGKRWGLANGYTGAQGGWIYNASNRPVCQGWRDFFYNFRHRILADVIAGRFKISHAKPAPLKLGSAVRVIPLSRNDTTGWTHVRLIASHGGELDRISIRPDNATTERISRAAAELAMRCTLHDGDRITIESPSSEE